MAFYKTSGGSVLEIDPPDAKNVHAAQRHAEAVERGELIEVPAEMVESYQDGPGTKFRLVAVALEQEPAKPKGKPKEDPKE